ncbi:MAG: hypothetical protein H0X40_18640 [Chthoniobacterales bacterium]|nr:hypothetical protein [Chthoniobacterales bacterium]
MLIPRNDKLPPLLCNERMKLPQLRTAEPVDAQNRWHDPTLYGNALAWQLTERES